MFSIRSFTPALILAIAIVGCAADPGSRTESTGSDDTTSAEPTSAPTSTEPAEPKLTQPAASAVCSAGGLFCCNVVAAAGTPLVASVLALLGVRADLVDESVGVTCQTVASASACTTVPTCCTSNLANLVALDCAAPNTP